jgi:hypothetical protein
MATQLHSSTRQQLDELDALLQKMLDQPGKPAEPVARPIYATEGGGNPPPKAPHFPPASVAYGVPPAVAFAAETPRQAVPVQKAVPSNWNIDLNPRGGSSVLGERSPLAEKLAPYMDSPQATPAFLQVTPIQNPIAEATNYHQVPIETSVRRFDSKSESTRSYGGLTAIPIVRDFLGYSGLAMLAASVTWAVLVWAGWF